MSNLRRVKTFWFIGNGVVIHIPQFFEELEALEAKGKLTCHAVLFIVVESILQGGYSRMFYVFFAGVTDWQGRLLVSDRAHIGKID